MSRLGGARGIARVAGAGVLLVLVMTSFVGTTGGVEAQTAADPVEITGSGTWSGNSFMTALANPMYNARVPTTLSYLAKGSRDGRRAFARGELDFVITGRPFADDEKAQLADRKVTVIEAPFSVGALAFLVAGPSPSGLRTLTPVVPGADPNDPETEFNSTPFTGPLKMPNSLLAKVFLESAGNNWYDPAFRTATFGTALPGPVINPLDPVVRSDPGVGTWALERFIKQSAPADWAAALTAARIPVDTLSESWPLLATPSRGGTAAISSLIGGWQSPRGANTPQGGAIGPVSPSDVQEQIAAQPAKPLADPPTLATPLYPVQIQNGAGEYIAPTTDTISKAAEVGQGADLYGLTETTPGVYPLTWINKIAVPAGGLSPEAATAVATLMRYGSTTGQSAQRVLGEGILPAALATQTLAAANQVIATNCTGSDRRVDTAADGGPAWPTGIALPAQAGGSFTVCTRIGTATTTTTTVASSGAGPAGGALPPSLSALVASVPASSATAGGSPGVSTAVDAATLTPSGASPGSDTSLGTAPVVDTTDPSGLGTAAGPAEANPGAPTAGTDAAVNKAVLASAKLPMTPPADGRFRLDRLTTMLLGGLIVLLLRGPARSFMRTAT